MNIFRCAAFGLALVVLGCGGGTGKVKAQGNLKAKDGTSLSVSDKGQIEIFFYSDQDDKVTFPADVKSDGSFEVNGSDGKGIPAGKYKVSVRILDPYHPVNAKDKLGERYYPPAKRIPVEVGSAPIVLTVETK
jgi:hypothetical protein